MGVQNFTISSDRWHQIHLIFFVSCCLKIGGSFIHIISNLSCTNQKKIQSLKLTVSAWKLAILKGWPSPPTIDFQGRQCQVSVSQWESKRPTLNVTNPPGHEAFRSGQIRGNNGEWPLNKPLFQGGGWHWGSTLRFPWFNQTVNLFTTFFSTPEAGPNCKHINKSPKSTVDDSENEANPSFNYPTVLQL